MRGWGEVAETDRKPEPEPRLWKSFEVDAIDLVRPDDYDFGALGVGQAFEVFRHAVGLVGARIAADSQGDGIARLLNAGKSGWRGGGIAPITSADDLKERFRWMLLARARGDDVRDWRRKAGLVVGGRVRVEAPHHRKGRIPWSTFGSDAAAFDCLGWITQGRAGSPMAVRMNHIHPDVRTLHGTKVHVVQAWEGREGCPGWPTHFRFEMGYGDAAPGEHGSAWRSTIARSRPGETFLDTLARARDVFVALVDGTPRHGTDFGDIDEYRRENVLRQVELIRTTRRRWAQAA